MPYPFIDNLPEYQFPGINPPRPGIVTFSAQRFLTPLATPQEGGILGQSNQPLAVVESTTSSTVGALVGLDLSLAPSSPFFTLLENRATSFRTSTWIRKLHSYYQNCASRARTTWKNVSKSFEAIGSYALSSFKCLWEFVVRATVLFRRRAMNIVEPLANSRLPTIRVEI